MSEQGTRSRVGECCLSMAQERIAIQMPKPGNILGQPVHSVISPRDGGSQV